MGKSKGRVLLVSEYFLPHWTGISQAFFYLAQNLQDQGYDVVVLTTQFDKDLALEAFDLGDIYDDSIQMYLREIGKVGLLSGTENIDFGFHRTALLGYKPCLSITDTAVKDSIPPAAQFLGLLKLANNKGVMDGTDIGTTPLVSRRSFLRFLQRATCVPLMKNVTQVPNNLQKGSDYFARTGIRLSDLPATQAWQDDTSVMCRQVRRKLPFFKMNQRVLLGF
jgi:hypothetical protein